MRLWIVILLLIPTIALSQCKDGISVIQFSADFVKSNELVIDKIKNAELLSVYLTQHPEFFKKEKIKYLPTVILYQKGKAIIRIESNITLTLPENTLDTIQHHINKIKNQKI